MYKNLQIFFITFLLFNESLLGSTSLYLGFIKSNDENFEPIHQYYRGGSRLIYPHKGVGSFEITIDNPFTSEIFFLFIDKEPTPVMQKDSKGLEIYNTFQGFTLSKDTQYRFFSCKKQLSGSWVVTESYINEQAILPLDTVIFLCLPEIIEKIEGGLGNELPTIYIKNLTTLGQDPLLIAQRIAKLNMASINLNTMHTPIKQVYNDSYDKVVVTLNV